MRRALVVDDEAVFRTLVTRAVEGFGFLTMSVASSAEATEALEEFDPDVVILDLALGEGPTGLDLLKVINTNYDWIAVLILTSFRSPDLVATLEEPINPRAGYVVKSDIVDIEVLRQAIEQTIAAHPPHQPAGGGEHPTITRSQAEVLRLMADGLSNAAIAEQRGSTPRALERLIARLYAALGLMDEPNMNPRVHAVRMYQAGDIDVR